MGAAEKLPELYTEEEAARYLGVSEVTLRRFRKQKRIGYIRIAKTPKYTEYHLLKYLEQHTCLPASALENTGSNSEKGQRFGIRHGATLRDASSALRLAQEILAKPR
ncbi:helix-turn-helix domain-containing protein [Xylella fastidiosa]|uniref:helix-turn-helix domain-containing protein n=1 Tax=Xylella fastidiosa TaxID=2371 RepID=UPI0012B39019|nr:helix-turn-helix domain-containing protein [Xylella fastidiosa]MDC6412868.1 helix-turn-helix domain-containing protein [Xylella fastidiosa subsp. multiplex]MDD0863755.1 helix-turn-helix domain-containing protein [Xylella fastidiosa subsp. multiplex]MDD0866349.1 helix-turn-helix domain-containing protein [Xylella fastidiosa subsp. multiplex]MDD0872584.1 helix-turn-helix domain-containing protein [Xylella fastidiosa subsp. multiplex]MDD0874913.1 helix-turn-helix domain-containing protein [Xyl